MNTASAISKTACLVFWLFLLSAPSGTFAQFADATSQLKGKLYKVHSAELTLSLEKYFHYPNTNRVIESDYFPSDEELKLPTKFQIHGDSPGRRNLLRNAGRYGFIKSLGDLTSSAKLNEMLVHFLQLHGLLLEPHSTAFFDPNKDIIIIRSTSRELDLAACALYEFIKCP